MLRITGLLLTSILLAVPAAGQQQQASSPAAEKMFQEYSKKVQGYSLALLVADSQSTSLPEGLSAPARKALTDIKDFLPFKGYRLLDTQWFAGSDSGATISGRFRGPEEQQILPFQLLASRLNQKFELWSADGKQILLESTFTMHVGETVVVGTSKVQGDKAVVVLLTIVEGQK